MSRFFLTLSTVVTLVLGCSSGAPKPDPSTSGSTTTDARTSPSSSSSSNSTSSAAAIQPLQVKMVSLKGGIFTMGIDDVSPDGELDASKPAHFATAPAFSIDVTEVTVDAYRRCVTAGVCTLPVDRPREFRSPPCNWFEAGREEHPINCVDWPQANTYCAWLGKQLPTEEMWEFAARGKHERDFPWGPSVPNQRWGAPLDVYERLEGSCRTADKESDYDTCPVGSAPKGVTPEGVLDLAGNVSEWMENSPCDYKTKKCDGTRKAARGGINDWYSAPYLTHSSARGFIAPDAGGPLLGFRCAKLDKP